MTKQPKPTKRVTTTKRVGPISLTTSETVPMATTFQWPAFWNISAIVVMFVLAIIGVNALSDSSGRIDHLWAAHVHEHPECARGENCAEVHR